MNTEEELAKSSKVVKSLLPLRLRYNYRDAWVFKQSYYDDPEGVNLLGKLIAVNKVLVVPTIVWAWADITMLSKVTGFQKMAGRFAYWSYPVVASATAFTTVTFAANRIRAKDDA